MDCIIFSHYFFKRADDQIYSNRSKSLMNNRQQKDVTLKEAKEMFGLWDNVYHQNAVKNLDPSSRWDPTKSSQEQKKKVEKVGSSSEKEIEGKYFAICLPICLFKRNPNRSLVKNVIFKFDYFSRTR